MVAVVQLVEHQVVILGVAGSSPVSHPEEIQGQGVFSTWIRCPDFVAWAHSPAGTRTQLCIGELVEEVTILGNSNLLFLYTSMLCASVRSSV